MLGLLDRLSSGNINFTNGVVCYESLVAGLLVHKQCLVTSRLYCLGLNDDLNHNWTWMVSNLLI